MTWYKIFLWYNKMNTRYLTELSYQQILKPITVEVFKNCLTPHGIHFWQNLYVTLGNESGLNLHAIAAGSNVLKVYIIQIIQYITAVYCVFLHIVFLPTSLMLHHWQSTIVPLTQEGWRMGIKYIYTPWVMILSNLTKATQKQASFQVINSFLIGEKPLPETDLTYNWTWHHKVSLMHNEWF